MTVRGSVALAFGLLALAGAASSADAQVAVSGNDKSLWWFCNEVRWRWLKSLKRRSQRARLSWERFIQATARFFPPIRVRHPLPCHRFDAKIRGKSPVR